MLHSIESALDRYARGKGWYWYVLPWLFGLYLFIQLLSFELGGELSFILTLGHTFNFFLHEMAHMLTGFLPPIMTAAAGSTSEILLGLLLIAGAFLTRGYFASLFCFLWFMLSTQATADYMADARSQHLPLVSFGGGDPIHDWNFVFDKLGLLDQDMLIASLVRGIGVAAGVFGLGFSAYMIIRMISLPKTAPEEGTTENPKLVNYNATPLDKQSPSSLYPEARSGHLSNLPPNTIKPSEPNNHDR